MGRAAGRVSGEDLAWLLGECPPAVDRLARWTRDVLLGAQPDLSERLLRGWHALSHHHPTAGYVVGLFSTTSVVLAFERGADLAPVSPLLRGERLRQVRYLDVVDEHEPGRDAIVGLLDAAVEVAGRR